MEKKKYFTWLLLLLSLPAFGQEIKKVRDIGLWAHVGVNYKIHKKWNLTFQQDIRFFDDLGKLSKVTSELGAHYKINNAFKIGGNLRYAYDRKGDYRFTHDIRYNIDFKYKLELSKAAQLEYRFRYQNNFVDLFTYYDEHTRKAHTRNRIELQYELKKHELSFSTEIFRKYVLYRKPTYNMLRFSLGDQLKTPLGKIEYSLNYARELNTKYPMNFFFISMGYTFHFKHA